MSKFDEIYEMAADNYGLVSSSDAARASVSKTELSRWAKKGWLNHIGHGLYRLARYTSTEYDRFAEAVAQVGKGAFLIGESVLAMHGLALVNPKSLSVGTTMRIRKKLPDWISVVTIRNENPTVYEGIPSQSVADALLFCRKIIMTDRLIDAANDARKQGLITATEHDEILKELQ